MASKVMMPGSLPQVFSREEFINARFRYRTGEHLTILGPTGDGKTTLVGQLLGAVASPQVPAIVCAMKPRDPTMTKLAKTLGMPTIPDWPPPKLSLNRLLRKKPPGWVLWAKHTFDPDVDDLHLGAIYRRAMLDAYQHGNKIVFVDELLELNDLKYMEGTKVRRLTDIGRTIYTRGRSMGCGLWGGSQKPSDIGTYCYGNSQHMILSNDPDRRNRDRYNEIGGFDGNQLSRWVLSLHPHQFLYLRRDGRVACIIDKD